MSGRDPRALWFVGPRRVELRTEARPTLTEGQVRVRGLASGVSQGTELLLFRGEGPRPFDPSLPDADDYPLRYGYAWVGQIVQLGPGVDQAKLGRRVFALAPHAEEHVLGVDQVRLLPESIPAERATLAANVETALTCVWDAEVAVGERVLVFGGGVVGLLTAWLLERSGASVVVVEPSETRRRAGGALLGSKARIVARAPADADADRTVEATGHPAVLDDAIAATRLEGRIVVASFYGQRRSPLALGDAFHRRRLTLRASQVSMIPPRLAPRWDHARRFALVAELLTEPRLDELFGPPTPFARAEELFERLAVDADAAPAHALVHP